MPTSLDAPAECAFCGRRRDEVRVLVAGPTAHICDECVAFCNEVIASRAPVEPVPPASEEDERAGLKSALHTYALDRFLAGVTGPVLERDMRTLLAAVLLEVNHFSLDEAAAFATLSRDDFVNALRELGPPSDGTIRPSTPPPKDD
jgi:hypothetical protein